MSNFPPAIHFSLLSDCTVGHGSTAVRKGFCNIPDQSFWDALILAIPALCLVGINDICEIPMGAPVHVHPERHELIIDQLASISKTSSERSNALKTRDVHQSIVTGQLPWYFGRWIFDIAIEESGIGPLLFAHQDEFAVYSLKKKSMIRLE